MFRHILNFLRTNSLNIPEPFDEIDQLYDEAKYYDIHDLVRFVIINLSCPNTLKCFPPTLGYLKKGWNIAVIVASLPDHVK